MRRATRRVRRPAWRRARRNRCRRSYSLSLLLGAQALLELAEQRVDGDSILRHAVAVTDRDRTVVEGVEVDRDAQRRPDLVLPAVAAADRPGGVDVDLQAQPEHRRDLV